MYKIIKIGDKEIPMLANGMLRMYYRSNFNQKLFSDLVATGKLKKLEKINKDNLDDAIEDDELSMLEDAADNCLKMAWTMAYCQDKSILPFEQWVESLGEFKLFDSWLNEVLKLAMSTFR